MGVDKVSEDEAPPETDNALSEGGVERGFVVLEDDAGTTAKGDLTASTAEKAESNTGIHDNLILTT